jgi:hypothetical protein
MINFPVGIRADYIFLYTNGDGINISVGAHWASNFPGTDELMESQESLRVGLEKHTGLKLRPMTDDEITAYRQEQEKDDREQDDD